MRKRANVYTPYILTLVGCLLFWYFNGVMFTAAAGADFVVYVSFISCILNFGIASWLFFHTLRIGRVISITLNLLTALMPIYGLMTLLNHREPYDDFYIIIYVIFILWFCSIATIHLTQINRKTEVEKWIKWILTLIPAVLSTVYILFILNLI